MEAPNAPSLPRLFSSLAARSPRSGARMARPRAASRRGGKLGRPARGDPLPRGFPRSRGGARGGAHTLGRARPAAPPCPAGPPPDALTFEARRTYLAGHAGWRYAEMEVSFQAVTGN